MRLLLLQRSDESQLLDFCLRASVLWAAVSEIIVRWEPLLGCDIVHRWGPSRFLAPFKPSNCSLSLPGSSWLDRQRPHPWGIRTILMCHVFYSHTAVQNDLSSRTLTLDCALLHDISCLLRGREVIHGLWISSVRFSLQCNVANVGSDPHRSSWDAGRLIKMPERMENFNLFLPPKQFSFWFSRPQPILLRQLFFKNMYFFLLICPV